MSEPFKIIDGIKCYRPEVAEAYDDYPAEGFDLTHRESGHSFWVRSRNRLFKFLVHSYAAPGRRTRLLDIGCGTGDFIANLMSDDRFEITGSEIYVRGLAYAKRMLPSIDFVQFDVTHGRMESSFDQITAFDVLEHVEQDERAMANMHAMLSPGGHVIISVPQHRFMWSRLDELVHHKRRYTRRELTDKLRAQGFEIERVTSFVFALFPAMLVQRLLDKGPSPQQSQSAALASRVTFSKGVNWLLGAIMLVDEVLIRVGLSLPFGGTLVAVARKN